MRLDKYLKVARLIKRRTLAQEMIENGAVRLGGKVPKSASEVRPGDRVEIAYPTRLLRLCVRNAEEGELRRGAEPFEILEERRLDPEVSPWADEGHSREGRP